MRPLNGCHRPSCRGGRSGEEHLPMRKDTQWWLTPGGWDLLGADDTEATSIVAGAPSPFAASDVQIVFIDGSVPDAQTLAQGVQPGVIAVVLAPDSDGVQQIADWLTNHRVQGAGAIDIVAHGADGEMQLGNVLLSAATI